MQLTGTIKTIRDIQQVSASFQKREFIIETLDQYPQTIQLELHQDKVDVIDAYVVGEEVVCDINIRGKIWVNPRGEEKCFNTIVAWRIQRPANSTPAPSAETKNSPKEFPQSNMTNSFVDGPATNFNEEEHDDLPF